jgi:hypothetical protein
MRKGRGERNAWDGGRSLLRFGEAGCWTQVSGDARAPWRMINLDVASWQSLSGPLRAGICPETPYPVKCFRDRPRRPPRTTRAAASTSCGAAGGRPPRAEGPVHRRRRGGRPPSPSPTPRGWTALSHARGWPTLWGSRR